MFENLGKNPALMWSSGLESTLLLAMLIEAKAKFDVVQQGREEWTNAQKKRADKLIKEWNLKVFSYPPANISLIGQDDEITTVWEYAVTGGRIPLLRDVVEGERCIADLTTHRMYTSPIEWDMFIVGSRFDDKHYAMQSMIPSERWMVGEVEFYAPLAQWTREEVLAKSLEYGLDVEKEVDEGDISLCHNCIKGQGQVFCPKDNKYIDSVVWDRNANLEAFKKAYG